ncbi:MAG: sirohydrochlorin cobaltochelatase [Eubacterium sp.]|nr:sirohydrochlorin cobaltochelatase [Eubacterium sp.]
MKKKILSAVLALAVVATMGTPAMLTQADAATTSQQSVSALTNTEVTTTSLTIGENTATMFKPVYAYLSTEGSTTSLVVVLSGTGYQKLVMGGWSNAYETLGDAGEDTNRTEENGWLTYTASTVTNYEGKYEFTIPLSEDYLDSDENYVIPFLAVSNKYLTKYDDGEASKYKVFYGRQFTVNTSTNTLTTADYTNTIVDEVIGDLSVEDAEASISATPELVDELINANNSQTRTDNTDKYCELSRFYFNALTDEQKAEVEQADYFTEETGNADDDDPLNEAPTKTKEMLVVSFGTSYNSSRAATIGAVESAIAEANSDYDVRRAFTSQIIINHIQARDEEYINNVEQALDNAQQAEVTELVIVPTHLMSGSEYDELQETVDTYLSANTTWSVEVTYSDPLLTTDTDKSRVARYVVAAAAEDAGFSSTAQAVTDDETAFVFMGHGTSHEAKSTYTYMQEAMDNLNYSNCYVGTVEGEPESTSVDNIIAQVKADGYTKVVLRPLMVVAGDHANNDMAGDDEDSWKTLFTAAGFEVNCQVNGLGELEDIQALYNEHVAMALMTDSDKKEAAQTAADTAEATAIAEEKAAIAEAVDAKKIDLSKATVTLKTKSYTYDGKAKKPAVTVKVDGSVVSSSDYKVTYANNTNAGTAKVTVTATGDNTKNSKTTTFTIKKASSKLSASSVTKTYKMKALKKSKKTFKIGASSKTSVSYKVTKSNKKIKVNSKGKVTVKKGTKKGTYKVKVKVTSKATTNYNGASKTITIKVKVKK